MSDLEAIVVALGAGLTIAWGIALLVGVWRIREALVDEDFPPVDIVEGGRSFRVRVSRVRGRFGATYQLGKDAQVETVPPTFATAQAAKDQVRRLVASA